MRSLLICLALLALYAPFNCYAQEDEEATAIAEELAASSLALAESEVAAADGALQSVEASFSKVA